MRPNNSRLLPAVGLGVLLCVGVAMKQANADCDNKCRMRFDHYTSMKGCLTLNRDSCMFCKGGAGMYCDPQPYDFPNFSCTEVGELVLTHFESCEKVCPEVAGYTHLEAKNPAVTIDSWAGFRFKCTP